MFEKLCALLLLTSISILAQRNVETISVNDQEVQKAVNFYLSEDYNSAKNILEEIIDNNDKNADAYFVLSKVLNRMNELDDAIDAAEEAVELNDKNEDYHYNLAQLYIIDARDASIFRMPSLASGIREELEATLELNPNHIDAIVGLSNFYLRAPGIMGGDNEKAIVYAKKVKTIDEERGLLLLAQIYIELENYSEAQAATNNLIKLNEYTARRIMVQLCRAQNDETGMEEQWQNIESKFGNDPKCFGFYNDYGYFLLGKYRIDEAIEKFKKQVELAPDNSNAHDSLGEGYLNKGMLQESLAEYRKALEINPTFESALNKVEEIEDMLDN